MTTDSEYMSQEILEKLVGWRIVGSALSDDGESFGLIVQSPRHNVNEGPKRKTVWVDCDAEGNGPGWLNIEPE